MPETAYAIGAPSLTGSPCSTSSECYWANAPLPMRPWRHALTERLDATRARGARVRRRRAGGAAGRGGHAARARRALRAVLP